MKLRVFAYALFLSTKINFGWCLCQVDSAEISRTVQNQQSYPYRSFLYNGSIDDCNCDEKACMRKCCEENYAFADEMCVYNNNSVSFNVYDKKNPIRDPSLQQYLITGIPQCPNNYYRLEPMEFPEDEFFLQKDGRLWIPDEKNYVPVDTYCIETTDGDLWALACIPTSSEAEKNINIVGMIVSMPFLIATFILYALLPEKNIHGKSLMCYVLSLLVAYVLLCIINSKYLPRTICIATGLACLYFFTASFLWMNAMSIDIWWTFSGSRNYSGNTRANARKQFLLYNIYAWGVPLFLVFLVGLLNAFSSSTSWYNPQIGEGVCWIKGSIPELMYFYAPLALIIVVNLSMFAITALKIRKLQKDTAMLRSAQFKKHNEDEQERFKLYIRLSLAMGVNWIMEIVSWAVDWQVGTVPKPVWYLTDLCNALYGVIIFFIFACKKKIWIAAKNRSMCCQGEKTLDESPCHTTESAM